MNPASELLRYDCPAETWEEALPLGSGRLGAMIPGGVGAETVELNEDTLWSGRPGYLPRPGGPEVLVRTRALIGAGRYAEAGKLLTGEFLDTADSASYLPAGTLSLEYSSGAAAGYRRELDLTRAVAATEFTRGDVRFRREAFASFPAELLVFRIAADRPGQVRVKARLASQLRGAVRVEDGDLVCDGVCPWLDRYDRLEWESPEGLTGLKMQIRLRLLAEGGIVTAGEDALEAAGADAATLLVAIRSDFAGFAAEPGSRPGTPGERCRADLDRGAAAGYDQLLRQHLEDYQELYLRSALTLPERPGDLDASDRRLAAAGSDFSPALAALFWNYGRYLLIAASRPGTQPANLQGIWNKSLTPPWGCNYTTNINLEMNYWPGETAGLPECVHPLLAFIAEAAKTGEIAARGKYGASGWCLHHNSDLWRYPGAATGDARWGVFPLAGVWLCRHIAEHYRHGGDRKFLEAFYWVLEGAARFCCDLLLHDPATGEYYVSPSTSPENVFRDPATGEDAPAATASACDMALVRELFTDLAEFAAILGRDDELTAEVRLRLERLRPDRIGSDGRLLEYGAEFEEPEPNHRHLSHLYGVYPGCAYTRGEYFEAVKRALEKRGDFSTGWAMAWRVALWARFGDGERCRRILAGLMRPVDPRGPQNWGGGGGTYPNFFDAHPPFQIDGNYGATAGIGEMLLQSHKRNAEGHWIVELLPALPADWADGSFSGWRARGAVTVSATWRRGRVVECTLAAEASGVFELRMNGVPRTVELRPGAVAKIAE